MQKISFSNGSIVEPQFLNAIQSPTNFDSKLSRINFFSTTNNPEWEINQRDSLKDWELPDPDIEPYTSIGRLAHSGRVLGWTQLNESEPLTILYGPPKLTTLDFDGVSLLDTHHAIVESGSVMDIDFTIKYWERQLVSIGANLTSYIYYDFDFEQIISSSLLPSRQTRFIPLAKLVVGYSGDIVEYTDLRQSTYIDSLAFFSRRLTNTLYLNSSHTFESWQRAIVDTTAGSIILTVPDEDNSQDGDEIALTDISYSFDTNPVILRSSSTTTVNNTSEDWIIYNKGIYLELYYHKETRSWNFKSPPQNLEEASAPVGTFLRCGGETYLGIKLLADCPNLEPTPDFEGTYYYVPETSQCYKKFYSNFAIYSDGDSGVYAEPSIRCGATKQEIKEWTNL